MQIALNSRKELSLLSSLLTPLIGEEPRLPPPELPAFLPSTVVDFDGVEGFGLPNWRVAWTVFFFGEGDPLVARSNSETKK